MLIAIDPGEDTGWAIFAASGLVACGLGDPRTSPWHIADSIGAAWIESQVIHPRSKARPNDVLKLARDAGRWAGRYDSIAVDVFWVEPNAWKGGPVPKRVSHPRIRAKLAGNERVTLADACAGLTPSKQHNVLDAVGIGLWACKR